MASHVSISNLSNDDSQSAPYELVVEYIADAGGLEVVIEYNGISVAAQDASQTSGSLSFSLNYLNSTIGETVRAVLRVKAAPNTLVDTDTRTGLSFETDSPP
ncbi:hypothetical protein R5W23_002602 [Gemmata sp. JC673]|uniref:Cohesin domain-containing protein n=1 Tax=Gemmata algarum TaxID=2975278 RepID=A0ABU5F180_9BACT|nr:hypothetical protein [Gemmata algarum]MDY3561325.1 hypothetical protein [Gemmata algarum]